MSLLKLRKVPRTPDRWSKKSNKFESIATANARVIGKDKYCFNRPRFSMPVTDGKSLWAHWTYRVAIRWLCVMRFKVHATRLRALRTRLPSLS
jgi:hypothetical protein